MKRSEHLSPKELQWAVAHALEVHKLAEHKRQDLESCTGLDELRQMLLELGLPEQDVDASLATLDSALGIRRNKRRSQRRFMVFLVALFALAASLGLWFAWPAQSPQQIFINIQHKVPEHPPYHSWSTGTRLEGEAEAVLVKALQARHLSVVQKLHAKVVRRLFAGAVLQPSPTALRSMTESGLTLLGKARCAQTGGQPKEGLAVARSQVSIEARWPGDDTPMRRHQGEAEAGGDSLQEACEHATAAATATFAKSLADDLASRLRPSLHRSEHK